MTREKLNAYVRRSFHNLRSDQVEDMVQDGMVKFYTARVETEGGRAISALNAIHDAARKERTQTKNRLLEGEKSYEINVHFGHTGEKHSNTPTELAPARQNDVQTILEAKEILFSLPLSYQRVIMTKYIGHNSKSGSKALNISESCYRSLLSRAQRYARRMYA